MNAMGHDVPTFIGVDTSATSPKAIRKLVPDYMAMGSPGMAEMGEMEMPLPDNTLPMMTGFGQFGPIEMGGMFTVVKVREGLAATTTAIRARTSTRKARSPMRSRAMDGKHLVNRRHNRKRRQNPTKA